MTLLTDFQMQHLWILLLIITKPCPLLCLFFQKHLHFHMAFEGEELYSGLNQVIPRGFSLKVWSANCQVLSHFTPSRRCHDTWTRCLPATPEGCEAAQSLILHPGNSQGEGAWMRPVCYILMSSTFGFAFCCSTFLSCSFCKKNVKHAE